MTNQSNENKPMARKGALGKGISSLLGTSLETTPTFQTEREHVAGASRADPDPKQKDVSGHEASQVRAGNAVLQARIDHILVNPKQPRKFFDEQRLKELSLSIKQDGIIQPLVVIKNDHDDKTFILIAGERRWRAAKLAGLSTVPVIVKNIAPQDILRVALIENIQRADLNVIEEAEAISALIKELGLTQEQCAQQIGKDRTTIANMMRLLSLPSEIQGDLLEGRFTAGHARALLSLDDTKFMMRARDIVIKKNLTVRQTEQLCKRVKRLGSSQLQEKDAKSSDLDPNLEYLAERVRSTFRTKVRIIGSPARGRIELSYFNAAELERIIQIMDSRTRSV
jgi:ParB family chromosome partitioning protein